VAPPTDVKTSEKKRLRVIWIGISGMWLFLFGVGGCAHSRWETRAQAARIGYTLHPWAIVVGLAMTISGFVIAMMEKKRFDAQR
jgi:hypothetical protein